MRWVLFLGVMMLSLFSVSSRADTESVYDFTFKTLGAEELLPLSRFKGKVLLIVNTASKCGFTGQYAALETLYNRYKEQGLVVLGVPSNDFGAQELATGQEIATFCQVNYGVSFPMTAKEVVSGVGAHPFYRYAKQSLGFGTAPKWNFHKYLIGRDGRIRDYFNAPTKPDSKRMIRAIEAALEG